MAPRVSDNTTNETTDGTTDETTEEITDETTYKTMGGIPDEKTAETIERRGEVDLGQMRFNEETEHVVVLDNLRKVYGFPLKQVVAVEGLSLGIQQGECFGLLGLNGSGMTTTLKMLTGDISITSGSAHINGYAVKRDMQKIYGDIGYCSELNPMFDHMTCRQTIMMYAIILGLKHNYINLEINRFFDEFGMRWIVDKQVHRLSEGAKRVVSFAAAAISQPAVLLLDNPTDGMDPVTRRRTWTYIDKYARGGRTVVLTSHSVNECETLCTRIGIMVNGRLLCLGTPQDLKDRFTSGYTLKITTIEGRDNSDIKHFIETTYPGSVRKVERLTQLCYHFRAKSIDWKLLLGKLQAMKDSLEITEYYLSLSTLEQIFLDSYKSDFELEK